MIDVLEKLNGERITLVCKNNDDLIGHKSIRIVSDGKIIETECYIEKSRNCFSNSHVMFIVLPKEIKNFNTTDTIEII